MIIPTILATACALAAAFLAGRSVERMQHQCQPAADVDGLAAELADVLRPDRALIDQLRYMDGLVIVGDHPDLPGKGRIFLRLHRDACRSCVGGTILPVAAELLAATHEEDVA